MSNITMRIFNSSSCSPFDYHFFSPAMLCFQANDSRKNISDVVVVVTLSFDVKLRLQLDFLLLGQTCQDIMTECESAG